MTERLNGKGKEGRTEEGRGKSSRREWKGQKWFTIHLVSGALSTLPSGPQQSLIFFTARPICSLEKLEGPRVRAMLLLLLSNFRLSLESCFLAAFTGAKINDLQVYTSLCLYLNGLLWVNCVLWKDAPVLANVTLFGNSPCRCNQVKMRS